MYVCVSLSVDTVLSACLLACLAGWLSFCLSARMMDGWTVGRTEAWMDGWMDACLDACLPACLPACMPSCAAATVPPWFQFHVPAVVVGQLVACHMHGGSKDSSYAPVGHSAGSWTVAPGRLGLRACTCRSQSGRLSEMAQEAKDAAASQEFQCNWTITPSETCHGMPSSVVCVGNQRSPLV